VCGSGGGGWGGRSLNVERRGMGGRGRENGADGAGGNAPQEV
jgi:hypothetical protein